MQTVAELILSRLGSGAILGVGTGSTVMRVLKDLGPAVAKSGKSIHALTTSLQSSQMCQELGFLPLDPSYRGRLTYGFDGADEVDPQLRLIKGKGAAMLREKIVAAKCDTFAVIVDESKLVSRLGEKTAVPVETIPLAADYVERELAALGGRSIKLRDGMPGKHGPVLTELGNFVLDVTFDNISDSLEADIKAITGVVDSGLFTRQASEVYVLSDGKAPRVLSRK